MSTQHRILTALLTGALSLGLAASALAASFTDVPDTAYYAESVSWAVEKGITKGTTETTFSPNDRCTTAQILTFLWRANGSPAPGIENPFSNVEAGAYYADAAAWAFSKGAVSGETFNGSEPCTRASTMYYFWALSGKPEARNPASFSDVAADAPYAAAVSWAVEQGVTNGTTETTFAPDNICTRGQIATFLYRLLGKTAEQPETPEQPAASAAGYQDERITIAVPEKFADLIVVTDKSAEGILFSCAEKESVEAGAKQHPGEDWGDGWLFDIKRITEDEAHQLMCGDMSNEDLFAVDEDNMYYVYCHPSDVRLVREDYENIPKESMDRWGALNEWAAGVPAEILASGKGLTAFRAGNSELEILLNRVRYADEAFELVALDNGALSPEGSDKAAYVQRLLEGISVEMKPGMEIPDGEYISMRFREFDSRLDFFRTNGNILRIVFADDFENAALYQITYADGKTVACDIVDEWYKALAEKAPQAAGSESAA